MTLKEQKKMINEILDSNRKIFLAITGGGTRAISQLLENGGASSVFVGARVPYSIEDLCDFVGNGIYPNDKCCSLDMARRMAEAATWTAFADNCDKSDIVGLGCTASLCRHKGEREKRVNQAFICVVSKFKIMDIHVEFLDGKITRRQQEDMLSTLILSALADFVNPPPKYIQMYVESSTYVRIQWQGKRTGYEEK